MPNIINIKIITSTNYTFNFLSQRLSPFSKKRAVASLIGVVCMVNNYSIYFIMTFLFCFIVP